MKPLGKNVRIERGFVFHGDTMRVVDIVPRYEIKIKLEQLVVHRISPVNRSLYNQMFWDHTFNWEQE